MEKPSEAPVLPQVSKVPVHLIVKQGVAGAQRLRNSSDKVGTVARLETEAGVRALAEILQPQIRPILVTCSV